MPYVGVCLSDPQGGWSNNPPISSTYDTASAKKLTAKALALALERIICQYIDEILFVRYTLL